jgi:hypothetical protein
MPPLHLGIVLHLHEMKGEQGLFRARLFGKAARKRVFRLQPSVCVSLLFFL